MTNLLENNICLSCNKILYGMVFFCPYCGKKTTFNDNTIKQKNEDLLSDPPFTETTFVNEDVELNSIKSEVINIFNEETIPKQEVNIIKSDVKPEKLPDSQSNTKEKPRKIKWLFLASIIFCVLFFAVSKIESTFKKVSVYFQSKASKIVSMNTDKKTSNSTELINNVSQQAVKGIATRDEGKSEAARIVMLGALSEGKLLSASVSSLPKLEKVLEAAQKLHEISPRYQPQVTSAKANLDDARAKGDRYLMAYINKLAEINRYDEKQIEYAIGTIQNSGLDPRDKVVIDLLIKHIKSMSTTGSTDPASLLTDFNNSFKDYVD